jgi:phosphopantothenoylcysteine decarboxylase / phosphopantothenate---cysteine ligase
MRTSATGKKVILGVTGGIAAYKAIEVCRRLVDAGAHVVPVLTDDALRFVGEVTFSALASERARHSMWDDSEAIPHTQLGKSADVVVIAPATARFVACYAAGISEGLLAATVLATRAPVIVCPAMHTEMWEHPALQENLATLVRRGVHVVPPEAGRLAGGDVGEGRMAEPSRIVDAVLQVAATTGTATSAGKTVGLGNVDLKDRRVVVTAGGTREPIDPVRFIGNRSSGKQGHAIAEAAASRGAAVVLVTTTERGGPPGATVVKVDTAQSMLEAVLDHTGDADAVILAAAVADFRPKVTATEKLSRSDGIPEVVLEPTPDILAEVVRRRPPHQVIVGFAAETGDMAGRASRKLREKGVDLIVANDVSAPGVGFDHDTNAVTILGADGARVEVEMASKAKVAQAVLDAVVERLPDHGGTRGATIPRSDA